MAQSAAEIDAEAAQWAVRLCGSPLSPEEQDELDRWLAIDSRHPGALLRARAAWLDLDRLAALANKSVPQSTGAEERPPVRERLFERRRVLAAAVSALSLGIGAALWWASTDRGSVYVSEVGEIRRVTLSDGSTLVLNTASEARVLFGKAGREVQLVRGEALFEVTKDPTRPFQVRTDDVIVRAVGTVFAVRTQTQRVEVTVADGAVEVTAEHREGGSAARRVGTREEAILQGGRAIQVQRIRGEELERRLAWREGMADFDGESLAEAIEEINRHNHRHIVVNDPALAARPVVGVFRANDAANFAETVATALNAEVVAEGDVLYIRPRHAP
jgi:transmembrane sensor